MSKQAPRTFSRAFKLGAIARMDAGENVSALSRELGVKREKLYHWRSRYRAAELERKVGQQQLDLEFFREALRHVEALRRANGLPGVTASSPASRR